LLEIYVKSYSLDVRFHNNIAIDISNKELIAQWLYPLLQNPNKMMKNMIETYDLGQLILSAKKLIYRKKAHSRYYS
jgi:hypothetical protein